MFSKYNSLYCALFIKWDAKGIYYICIIGVFSGLVDQLEDRLLCKQEVARSNRAQSTHMFCSDCVVLYIPICLFGI